MLEYYEVLGVDENCSDEELKKAYDKLRAKYLDDRFLEGEVGNEAARKLTKIETAYNEIMEERNSQKTADGYSSKTFVKVENLIKDGKYDDAQRDLDDVTERDAEWHYLQSIIFYKKNWTNESLKQLEIAKDMDPTCAKYADAYDKLKTKIDNRNKQFYSGNANYSQKGNPNRQMGGDDFNECLDCCATWCCIDMLCNCCR